MAPYESTDFDSIRDIHWGFSNAGDAIEFADLRGRALIFDMIPITKTIFVRGVIKS